MDEGKIIALIRQEVRNALSGQSEETELDQKQILQDMQTQTLLRRVNELEQLLQAATEDAWHDGMNPQADFMGQVLLPSEGFWFQLADGTVFAVTLAQALAGDGGSNPAYDPSSDTDWSLEFSVSGGTINDYSESGSPAVMQNPVGTSTLNEPDSGEELLHDRDLSSSTAQTYYRIPIIRDGEYVCRGGVYRETVVCDGSRGDVAALERIA